MDILFVLLFTKSMAILLYKRSFCLAAFPLILPIFRLEEKAGAGWVMQDIIYTNTIEKNEKEEEHDDTEDVTN